MIVYTVTHVVVYCNTSRSPSNAPMLVCCTNLKVLTTLFETESVVRWCYGSHGSVTLTVQEQIVLTTYSIFQTPGILIKQVLKSECWYFAMITRFANDPQLITSALP